MRREVLAFLALPIAQNGLGQSAARLEFNLFAVSDKNGHGHSAQTE
jgi:hypothetical protein